jgi:glycogen debranching enzyme
MPTESSPLKPEETNLRTLGQWLDIDGISYIPSTVLLTGIQKISLKDDRAFAVLDNKGEAPMVYHAELGFYYNDTRYLSNWEMTVNGQTLVHLSHELRGKGNSCIFSMTNRDFDSVDGKTRIPRDTLLIRRVITLYRDSIFEHLEFTNFDAIDHQLEIRMVAKSAFDDIFEVRGLKRKIRGEVLPAQIDTSSSRATLRYRGLDGLVRTTHITSLPERPQFRPQIETFNGTVALTYRIVVPHKGRHDVKTILVFEQDPTKCLDLCDESFQLLTMTEHLQSVEALGRDTYLGGPRISSNNAIFDRGIKTARLDIETLTTLEPNKIAYPYAGIPWFSAPFGRDGILTAYQMLPWHPELARGVLDYVFETIGSKVDDFTEEEPGKIFHEMRRGEMARLKEIPYIPYYGSIDSTPLALVLLEEYIRWTNDSDNLRKWWPAALRALEWLRNAGNPSDSFFLKYKKKKPTGLDNQGWKDSHNSVMYADGTLAAPPIALCEVQAYAYRARKAMATLARGIGNENLGSELLYEAAILKKNFHSYFWDTQENYVVLALDGSDRRCSVMSSNQGHCLWGEILNQDEARLISDHLMSPRLFSGFGVRTLASDERAYNPLSYHNGSIWPHDNSLIAEGFRFYNRMPHLQALTDALFDVVALSEDFRLPELFCGFRRHAQEPPVPYEVACRPQAWAAGSLFLLLKAMLGLSMDPTHDSIIFKTPRLPSKVSILEIKGLQIRDTKFDAIISQGLNTCHIEIPKRTGTLPILVEK